MPPAPPANLAPLSRRALAGLIDGAALLLLSMISFVVPMLVLGVVLPMWGVLAVMLGWSVVPLAFLQKTVGMRVMGLELARHDGHPLDLANVLFRELLGRGLFPAAYLLTVIGGFIGRLLGVMAFAVPTGLGAIMLLACLAAFLFALAGGLLGLSRPDGRGLADLMTRSFVVIAPARPLPEDPEERAEHLAHRASVVRRIVVFELFLALAVIGTPWLLTVKTGESTAHRTERLKRAGLQKKFDATPGDDGVAEDLVASLERDGQLEEARKILERHAAAVRAREHDRERRLRENLTKTPDDERTAALLIELLEDQGRLDEAIVVYRGWLGPSPAPSRQAGFGHWLGVRGKEADAVTELRAALDRDPLVPMGHTMLGIVLSRLERFDEARTELFYALELDAEDEDARDAWAEVLATTGPLTKAQEAQLRATVKRWTADAGH